MRVSGWSGCFFMALFTFFVILNSRFVQRMMTWVLGMLNRSFVASCCCGFPSRARNRGVSSTTTTTW